MYVAAYYQKIERELRLLRKQLREVRSVERRAQVSVDQRLSALEEGLGRVALLTRSLAELSLERGVFTEEELGQKLRDVDLADGARDERLDPRSAMPGESRLAHLEPIPEPDPPADSGPATPC